MKCKLHKQIFASALGLIVFFPLIWNSGLKLKEAAQQQQFNR